MVSQSPPHTEQSEKKPFESALAHSGSTVVVPPELPPADVPPADVPPADVPPADVPPADVLPPDPLAGAPASPVVPALLEVVPACPPPPGELSSASVL
jgi:hypothetical protein